MAPSRGDVCLGGLALPSELLHELLYLIDVACWYHSTVIAEELGKVIRMEHHREMDLTGIVCPTPPIPDRNPNRISYENPLPPLPDGSFQIEKGLLPKPLFSKIKTLPPAQPSVASVQHRPSPVSRTSSTSTTSSRSSSKSSRSSVSSVFSSPSTPVSSAPTSPAVLARTFSFDPDTPWILASIKPEDVPRPLLRRKNTPRKGEETLRSLRAKGSDACLQRLIYQRTSAYLEGAMFEDEQCCSGLHNVMSNDNARQTYLSLA